jgi:hypothetical protein
VILNPWSVSALFLAAIGLALAATAVVVASRGMGSARSASARASREAGEDRGHLLVVVAAVLGLVRLLAWPQFYLLLRSYVPELAPFGVMCAFGVTRIEPTLVAAIELAKPLVLSGFGFWWLVVLLERRTDHAVFTRARNRLAVVLALAAAFESALEIAYVLHEKVGHPVTCCTQFLDTQAASAGASVAQQSPSVLGGHLALYCAVNALAVAFALAAWRAPNESSRWRAPASSLVLAALALANLWVTYSTWLAVVAPRVLGLPYHHCVYELLTDTPALGLAAVLACTGNACLLWPLGLAPWKSRAPEAVERLQSSVYAAGALSLASSIFIVLVHVF